jgi:hypothetical protein
MLNRLFTLVLMMVPIPVGAVVLATDTFQGHKYSLISANSWNGAEAEAVNLGGHLVTINTAAEDDFIANFLTSNGAHEAWIGLTLRNGTYVWVSGESVTYANWNSGEPNNTGGVEDSGMIDAQVGFPSYGHWNDLPNAGHTFAGQPVIPLMAVVEVDCQVAVSSCMTNPKDQSFTDGFEGPTINPFWTVSGSAVLTSTNANSGSQSLQLAPSSSISHNFASPVFGSVSVHFYDDGIVHPNTSTSFGLFPLSQPPGYYLALPYGCSNYENGIGISGTCGLGHRSAGWHLFRLDFTPTGGDYIIDGAVVETWDIPVTFSGILIGNQATPVAATLIDDFSMTTTAITVFPNQGTNSGSVSVELTGSSLLSGAQVALSGGGFPIIPGTNALNPSPSILTATFNLIDAATGPRDVVIIPRSGVPITLAGAFTILPTPGCSYTVAPLNPSFPASGGGGSIVVTSNVNTSQCNFHVFDSFPTKVAWITPGLIPHFVIGGAGSIAESLVYQVAANPSVESRSTTVSIFGQNVVVSQAGIGACTYNFSPTSEILAANGGAANISILTAGGCPWSASSSLSWVRVIAGSPGSGVGVVTIQADPNAGGLRSGFITIGGKTFSVSQSASACGATDVSSQVSVARGTVFADFLGNDYTQKITLQNQGTTNIAGPIYLVLDGLPATRFECGTFFGQTQTCGVLNASRLTFCQSPPGSDMVVFTPNGLASGQQVSLVLTFVPGRVGGASAPSWFTTRVFSGTPNQ